MVKKSNLASSFFILCILSSVFRMTTYNLTLIFELVSILTGFLIISRRSLNKYFVFFLTISFLIIMMSLMNFENKKYFFIINKNFILFSISLFVFYKYRVSDKFIFILFFIMILSYAIEYFTGFGLKSILSMDNTYWNQTRRLTGIFSNYHYSSFLYATLLFFVAKKKWYFLIALCPILFLTGVYTSIIAFTLCLPLICITKKTTKVFNFLTILLIFPFLYLLTEYIELFTSYLDFPKKNSLLTIIDVIRNIQFSELFNLLPQDFSIFHDKFNEETVFFLHFSDIGYFMYFYQYGMLFPLMLFIYYQLFISYFLFILLTLIHNSYFMDPLVVAVYCAIAKQRITSSIRIKC